MRDNDARAQILLQQAERIAAQARELEVALPGQISSRSEARAYAVWWATVERYWKVYGQALAQIFGDIENQDDVVIRAKIAIRDLDELGRRIKDFMEFCEQEVVPVMTRLENGISHITSLPPNHPSFRAAVQHWQELRYKIRKAIPAAWRLISPAAHYYAALPAEMREEADSIWGPICGKTDPFDFSPLWLRYFPVNRLRDIDLAAKKLGIGAGQWQPTPTSRELPPTPSGSKDSTPDTAKPS